MAGVSSKFFEKGKCNCNARSRINGKCIFNGKCNTTCAVYEYRCKKTGKSYIGQTQNAVKTRLSAHLSQAKKFATTNEKSDSFATYFGQLLLDKKREDPSMASKDFSSFLRGNLSCSILWTGNPISCMKSFGTHGCQLCMKVRVEITKRWLKSPNSLVNSCSEIYGACRHKSRFHWFTVDGTDEANAEKVIEVEEEPGGLSNGHLSPIPENSTT